MAEVQRLTNPQIFDAETVQLYHFTFMTLEQTAEEAGYVTYYSRGTGELGEETIRVNYEDSNGNTIPVHTDVVGRGKALTYIGDERVPGTGFSSDNEWQSNALKTAFVSIDNNLTLAAKKVQSQIENISGDPRELPQDAKFPKTGGLIPVFWRQNLMENLPQRLRQKRNPLRFIVKGRGQNYLTSQRFPRNYKNS
nr:hypothetical protein [Salmonella enterica]WCS70341.1 DNA primase [Salmonella enterica subsp. enterica serovar Rissen]